MDSIKRKRKQKFSYLSPKAQSMESPIHGLGVFAIKKIQKNEVIAIFGGRIMHLKDFQKIAGKQYKGIPIDCFPLQVNDNFFLSLENVNEVEDSDFFNHSCEPNAGIKGQITLVARREIKPKEEITFDYTTTESLFPKFRCHCGSKECRVVVTKDDWKNPAFQRKNKGYLSSYIENKIKALKKFKSNYEKAKSFRKKNRSQKN